MYDIPRNIAKQLTTDELCLLTYIVRKQHMASMLTHWRNLCIKFPDHYKKVSTNLQESAMSYDVICTT